MKPYRVLTFVMISAMTLAACAPGAASPPPAGAPDDLQALVTALETAGATVEAGATVSQPFFSPEGQILRVSGQDVQVFEYEGSEEMEDEAAEVAPDGGSVGTTMLAWIDTPHFYKSGRIIVLYVGHEQDILDLLVGALGDQFAGG